MWMLNLPNCNIDSLACDISSELYTEYQTKVYGLRNCDVSCKIGDLDERFLLKYILDSGIPIEHLLPKPKDDDDDRNSEILIIKQEPERKVIQIVNKTVINQITNNNSNFVYTQTVSSDRWVVIHNLGYYPSVSVVDTTNTVVEASIQYIDSNQVVINFNGPFVGKAFLS